MDIKHLLDSKSQQQINSHQCLQELQDLLNKEDLPKMPNVNSTFALKSFLKEKCHNSLFTCARYYCEYSKNNLYTTQEREALRLFIIRTFDTERQKHTEQENESARINAGSYSGIVYKIYNDDALDIILFVGKMHDILKSR